MFLRNLVSVILPALLALALSWILNNYTVIVTGDFYFGLIFFTAFCFIFNLIYAHFAESESFTQLLIGGVVIKLLLAIVVIFACAVINNPGFFNFSIHFILYYVLFTIFEIWYILYLIKNRRIKI